MVVDYDLVTFYEWLFPSPEGPGAAVQFIFTLAVMALGGVILGYLVSMKRHGVVEGFYALAQMIVAAPRDLFGLSVKRVLAIALLAVQEAIRRRVLVVFAVFVVVLLLAGWYLDVESDHPSELYLSFVLGSTTYLVLLMSLFISAFSLPNDIKHRTIYTVVTKPVRASEIVMGRIIGFALVGTGLLTLMCLVSWGFVVRGLSHGHTVLATDLKTEIVEGREVLRGETSSDNFHRHTFTIEEGKDFGRTDTVMDHWHLVEKDGQGGVRVLAPEGAPPRGRVPKWGKLSFLDRTGGEGKGVNVGYEWKYRQFIEGGTLASAIWRFENVTESQFKDGIPLEMTLRVFRTHKGEIVRGVLGEITVMNPDPTARIQQSTPINFTIKEFATDERFIDRKLTALGPDRATIEEVDLFKDLVTDGAVDIKIRCAERAQYFGMAQADLYIKEGDRPFFVNFMKGFMHIWMQMVVVTSFGVAFSTFLSGPVSMLGSLAAIILGIFSRFVSGVFGDLFEQNPFLVRLLGTVMGKEDNVVGGGPIESLIRLVTQKNLTVDLDISMVLVNTVKWIDAFFMGILYTVTRVLPDFRMLDRSADVAKGFDITTQMLVQNGLVTLSFFLVLSLIGYFFLKSREIAA